MLCLSQCITSGGMWCQFVLLLILFSNLGTARCNTVHWARYCGKGCGASGLSLMWHPFHIFLCSPAWKLRYSLFTHSPLFFFAEEYSPWANICCQFSSFCLRKIVPELTSVPVFLYFLYVGCCHSMAWWVGCKSILDLNPPTLGCQSGAQEPNFSPPGWLLGHFLLSYHAFFSNITIR